MESSKTLSITLSYCTGISSEKTLASTTGDYTKSWDLILCLSLLWSEISVKDQELRYFSLLMALNT